MAKHIKIIAILSLLALVLPARALEVLEPGCAVQTYAAYPDPGSGHPRNMKFDSNRNLYLVHSYDNCIWRVAPDGSAGPFLSSINTPYGIESTSGTSYGDSLYVVANTEILRAVSNGTTSRFANNFPAGGSALAVDRTGNYGGYLYLTTGGQDHIYRVATDGSVEMFSEWPGWTDGGGPVGIHFDHGNDYGGLLYVASYFGKANAHISGIFTLDTNGNAARFTDDLVAALHIDFDETGFFGGRLFTIAKSRFDEDYAVWSVSPEGKAEKFALIAPPHAGLSFGPDGALYIGENDADTKTIVVSRISKGSSLVARWAFDEGRGNIAYDSVGAKHGKIHGAQWTTGIIDRALSFQGKGDYVEIPDADSLTPRSAFTISYWLYIRDWEGAGIYKMALCPDGSASPGNSRSYLLAVNATDKNVHFRLFSAARTYDELVSLGRVTPNQWQHISATFNRGQAAVYINGHLDNAAQLKVKSIMNDAYPLIIGGLWSYCDDDHLDDHFVDTMGGAINNLMIFNRALSPEEIGRLYRNGLGFDPTSVGTENTGYYIPPDRRY